MDNFTCFRQKCVQIGPKVGLKKCVQIGRKCVQIGRKCVQIGPKVGPKSHSPIKKDTEILKTENYKIRKWNILMFKISENKKIRKLK